jgi:hypothetical protein
MTNKYLAKLHSLERGTSADFFKTRDPKAPAKRSKTSSEGFAGDQGWRISENGTNPAEVDPCLNGMVENEKTGTPNNPQYPQNLGSPSEASAVYRATSVGPDGADCSVEIVELPQAQRYRNAFGVLELRPPALVPIDRWRQCIEDGRRFLATWERQAGAFGWDSADLFGLAPVPEQPHPSYRRLSRYDQSGLIWLLEGRDVIALTEATATIRSPARGSLTTYRRFNKPALGRWAIHWTISNDWIEQ